MAKHARVRTDEQRERLERNRQTMALVLEGTAAREHHSTQTAGLSLVLERIVCDHATGRPVGYEGAYGVQQLLSQLAETYAGGEIVCEGHLVGVRGTLAIEGQEAPVDLKASVGVGGQLALEVGPSPTLSALLDAIRVFDRQAHLAANVLGRDLDLVAQGMSPVSSPSDVVPVPLSRNVLLGTYLSRTGRYSRDALRCTAATCLRLSVPSDEQEAAETYRLFAVLAPVLAFLCDNTLSLRGCDPHDTPRMSRALMWQQVDPARCGLIPASLRQGFGFVPYERWLEEVRPILFESDEGITFSTGTDTCQRVMEERDLSTSEAERLTRQVWPDVRWDGRLTLRCADSLPPRLAVGYAALAKGITTSIEARLAAWQLVSARDIDEDDVERAWHDLRELGWDARVYGRPVGQIADELAAIASRDLPDRDERRLLDSLAQLWQVRMVPRDLMVRNWERAQRSSIDEVIELYGEGAVIPYEELGGEPPAGQTAVMRPLDPTE